VSQARPAKQSLEPMQPHMPSGPQAVPEAFAVQETHDPSVPHASAAVPGAQVPPLQHPPLQGWVEEHAVVQACVVRSHA